MQRQLYGGAALLLSPAAEGASTGAFRSLSPVTSLRNLFVEFAGRIAAARSMPE